MKFLTEGENILYCGMFLDQRSRTIARVPAGIHFFLLRKGDEKMKRIVAAAAVLLVSGILPAGEWPMGRTINLTVPYGAK